MLQSRSARAVFYGAILTMVGVATWVRVAPLIEGGDRLQRQCVSEDGYLMLTIARNAAMGRGFSVSDGEIATNGTQPLCSLLYALCFHLVDADKIEGLYLVVGVQVLISMVTAILIYVLVRKYLYRSGSAQLVALLAAVVWYASPTSVIHTQNSLETGLCSLMILLSIVAYDAMGPVLHTRFAWGRCGLLGIILGLTFLARNDTCFLIAAMLAIHLVLSYRRERLAAGLVQAFAIGTVSIVVASPWLWFNITRFGHVVPVSGRAEALNVRFASNFMPALSAMLEDVLLVLRIPMAIESRMSVRVGAGAVLIVALAVAFVKRRWLTDRFSVGVGVLAAFVGALFLYYALFFGMPSFLGRYFFPATMLTAIVAAGVMVSTMERLGMADRGVAPVVVGLLCAALASGLNIRTYRKGTEHLHFQVVDWVKANVAESTWVGAAQTGTLGFHHDRTINLDGKVNPEALEAKMQNRIPQYAFERGVEYIVDWRGLAVEWIKSDAVSANYELLVADEQLNLGVLRRRTAVQRQTRR